MSTEYNTMGNLTPVNHTASPKFSNMADRDTGAVFTPNANSNPALDQTDANQGLTGFFYVKHKLGRACVSEFFGTYVFLTLALGSIAIYVIYPESGLNWLGVAIAWGIAIMIGIRCVGANSPGHLNPCVSLCAFLDKSISFSELILYSLMQLLAAFLASITVYCIYYNNVHRLADKQATSIFTTYKHDSITKVSAFFTEFTATAFFVGGIFLIINHNKMKHYAPEYIGLLIAVVILTFGYQTAFALNAARDFGPRLFMSMLGYSPFNYVGTYFWIPLVATYTGAIFGYLMYLIFFRHQNRTVYTHEHDGHHLTGHYRNERGLHGNQHGLHNRVNHPVV